METKRCSGCDTVKAVSDFFRNASRRDGLMTYCKACETDRKQVKYRANPEYRARMIATATAWHHTKVATPEGRDALRVRKRETRQQSETQQRWFAEYGKSVQRKAKFAVNTEVAAGRLPRVVSHTCADCGNQAKHYHHWSYAPEHWLDVIPLCAQCHADRHRSFSPPS